MYSTDRLEVQLCSTGLSEISSWGLCFNGLMVHTSVEVMMAVCSMQVWHASVAWDM